MNRININKDIIITKNSNLKLVHISDIHFSKKTKIRNIETLKNKIVKLNPDYLLITGDLLDEIDIIDNKIISDYINKFLLDLSKHMIILISLGNHEGFTSKTINYFNKLNKIPNINILNNSYYIDKNIYVVGLTLTSNYYYSKKEENTKELVNIINKNNNIINKKTNLYNILMVHSPIKIIEVIDKLTNFNLILTGHTHNGLVPQKLFKIIPGNCGIVAPNNRLFPKIAKGKIERIINNKKITIIINGAITKLSYESGSILSNFNFLYNMDLNLIELRNK